MKVLKVFFPLLLVSSLSLPFLLKGADGKPIMDFDSLFSSKNGEGFSFLGKSPKGGSSNPTANKYYRWQDASGQWHFSDKADPTSHQRGEVEEVAMSKQVNLMDGIEVQKQAENSVMSDPQRRSIPFPTTIDPRDIPKLIDDAKNVQNLVDNRTKELEKY